MKKKWPFILALTVFIVFSSYLLYFFDKIYPGIYIANVYVGGLTQEKALVKLKQSISFPTESFLQGPEKKYKLDLKSIDFTYNLEDSIQKAFLVGRTGNYLYDAERIMPLLSKRSNIGLSVNLNEEKVKAYFSLLASDIETNPIYPTIKIASGKISIDKGKKGEVIDYAKTRAEMGSILASLENKDAKIYLKEINPTLSDQEAATFQDTAQKLYEKSLTLKLEEQRFIIKEGDLIRLINFRGGFNEKEIALTINQITKGVNRESQNPVFIFLPAQAGSDGRVKEFSPAKDSIEVKNEELKEKIMESLKSLSEDSQQDMAIEIPVIKTSPKISTGEVNNLGIKELIGKGTSRFKGSIPSRIHNISLAASRMNGTLIEPGQAFSFNDALGDVSKFTGYKEAFIIKDGKTVLGDGGGVCQVSTTLFRAALNAGLPITERRAHAYRVSYYEQDSPPGLDATVYSPTTDLKIKNDTQNYVLIQAKADTKNLTLAFELYGTKDGRISNISKSKITEVVAPPEDLYQDDPTLPIGTTKQIDFKAWGAKVVFNYSVEKEGKVIYQKTFTSNYHPWQAVFLRGIGPSQ
ncbi:MAG: VanW family protein [Patescibacteria group bacterium]